MSHSWSRIVPVAARQAKPPAPPASCHRKSVSSRTDQSVSCHKNRLTQPGGAGGFACRAAPARHFKLYAGTFLRLFLVFSAAVILFNLLADLLYVALDPRVRT